MTFKDPLQSPYHLLGEVRNDIGQAKGLDGKTYMLSKVNDRSVSGELLWVTARTEDGMLVGLYHSGSRTINRIGTTALIPVDMEDKETIATLTKASLL